MAGEVTHLLSLAEGDSPAARWLAEAISGLCQGRGWAEALGAHPAQVARAVRDNHLRHAAQLLGGDPIELHRLAGRFETCVWPRWRRAGPPADAGLVNVLLFRARRAAPLPTSSRQYRRILKG